MKLRDLTQERLGRLNSATKYPSILTYHAMGDRGRLSDAVTVKFDPDDELVVTEKIDGTNVRVIVSENDFIIGSREDLLYADGDLIRNPYRRIVDAMLDLDLISNIRDVLADLEIPPRAIHDEAPGVHVLYGELYGGKIGKGAKQYTSSGEFAFRLFDIAGFSNLVIHQLLALEREDIAQWRKQGEQHFWRHEARMHLCKEAKIPMVPLLHATTPPPTDLASAFSWLSSMLPQASHARLDTKAQGLAEGVVVRTADRSKIAKLRVADYRRTL